MFWPDFTYLSVELHITMTPFLSLIFILGFNLLFIFWF